MNPDLAGEFRHYVEGDGFTLQNLPPVAGWFGRTKDIFRFRLIHSHPLEWIQRDGTRLRPAAQFDTDGVSSPLMAKGFCSTFRFVGAFLHDSGYKFRGLQVCSPGENRFRFAAMDQKTLDRLLRVWCRYDPWLPCGFWKAAIIYRLLRLGGWVAWRNGGTPPSPKGGQRPPGRVAAVVGGLVLGIATGLLAGCVCQPGGRITVNIGYRAVQAGSVTNQVYTSDGGGSLPVSGL